MRDIVVRAKHGERLASARLSVSEDGGIEALDEGLKHAAHLDAVKLYFDDVLGS
jgi:hypothetical protein